MIKPFARKVALEDEIDFSQPEIENWKSLSLPSLTEVHKAQIRQFQFLVEKVRDASNFNVNGNNTDNDAATVWDFNVSAESAAEKCEKSAAVKYEKGIARNTKNFNVQSETGLSNVYRIVELFSNCDRKCIFRSDGVVSECLALLPYVRSTCEKNGVELENAIAMVYYLLEEEVSARFVAPMVLGFLTYCLHFEKPSAKRCLRRRSKRLSGEVLKERSGLDFIAWNGDKKTSKMEGICLYLVERIIARVHAKSAEKQGLNDIVAVGKWLDAFLKERGMQKLVYFMNGEDSSIRLCAFQIAEYVVYLNRHGDMDQLLYQKVMAQTLSTIEECMDLPFKLHNTLNDGIQINTQVFLAALRLLVNCTNQKQMVQNAKLDGPTTIVRVLSSIGNSKQSTKVKFDMYLSTLSILTNYVEHNPTLRGSLANFNLKLIQRSRCSSSTPHKATSSNFGHFVLQLFSEQCSSFQHHLVGNTKLQDSDNWSLESLILAGNCALLIGCLIRDHFPNTKMILLHSTQVSTISFIKVLEAFVALYSQIGVMSKDVLHSVLQVIKEFQSIENTLRENHVPLSPTSISLQPNLLDILIAPVATATPTAQVPKRRPICTPPAAAFHLSRGKKRAIKACTADTAIDLTNALNDQHDERVARNAKPNPKPKKAQSTFSNANPSQRKKGLKRTDNVSGSIFDFDSN